MASLDILLCSEAFDVDLSKTEEPRSLEYCDDATLPADIAREGALGLNPEGSETAEGGWLRSGVLAMLPIEGREGTGGRGV